MNKLPPQSVLENYIRAYIERIEKEKIPKEKLDTLFILKRILRYW